MKAVACWCVQSEMMRSRHKSSNARVSPTSAKDWLSAVLVSFFGPYLIYAASLRSGAAGWLTDSVYRWSSTSTGWCRNHRCKNGGTLDHVVISGCRPFQVANSLRQGWVSYILYHQPGHVPYQVYEPVTMTLRLSRPHARVEGGGGVHPRSHRLWVSSS